MKRTKFFIINSLILAISSFIMRAIGLFFNLYIGNILGKETIGLYNLLISIYLLFISFCTSGISLSCIILVSYAFEKKNYILGLKIVKNCICLSLIISIFSSLILFYFSPTISNILFKNIHFQKCILIICLILPFISISSCIEGYFKSIGKSYIISLLQFFSIILKIFITYFLINFKENRIDYTCFYLILSDSFGEFIYLIFSLIIYFLDTKKYIKNTKTPKKLFKTIIKISFPVSLTSFFRSFLSSLKQFLVPLRLEVYGFTYNLAISKYGLINGMVMPILLFANFFILPFCSLLVPEYSRLLAGKNYKRINFVFCKIFIIILNFSFLLCGIFLLFHNNISFLIYKNIEVGKYLSLFSFLIIFIYLDNIIDSTLKGLNCQYEVMIINIIDLIISIQIIYFLIPNIGVNGYIFSIFFSEIFNFIFSFYILKRKLNISINFFSYIIKPCLIFIISTLVSSFFYINVLIKFFVFIILYTILFILFYKKDNLIINN